MAYSDALRRPNLSRHTRSTSSWIETFPARRINTAVTSRDREAANRRQQRVSGTGRYQARVVGGDADVARARAIIRMLNAETELANAVLPAIGKCAHPGARKRAKGVLHLIYWPV